jgi:hypothetical protein
MIVMETILKSAPDVSASLLEQSLGHLIEVKSRQAVAKLLWEKHIKLWPGRGL